MGIYLLWNIIQRINMGKIGLRSLIKPKNLDKSIYRTISHMNDGDGVIKKILPKYVLHIILIPRNRLIKDPLSAEQ